MGKIIFGLLLAVMIFLMPTSEVLAACPANSVQTDLGCINASNPLQFASDIYGMGLSLIGGVALLFIIWGGYTILSSQGNPSALAKGKSYIYYSIVGLVLAASGFAVYQLVARNILKLPGF